MKMRVVWLVGENGPVKAPDNLRLQPHPIPYIYRAVPSVYRYAVGWSDGKLTVLDVYQTALSSHDPSTVKGKFIDKYVDMDQAIAALTIRYEQSWRAKEVREIDKMLDKLEGS